MIETSSIVLRLQNMIDENEAFKTELEECIKAADWTPPYRDTPLAGPTQNPKVRGSV